ncbi:cagE, TrbE, VirB, component of type IV transporter system family protein [Orientia chuto str. Dubai]|uniref:CagE, TrbE, VirB, component of type IV transporter system family protein n=1 Tax=Orientia chuto str. Dubai TaxID=1359168 RepID=A0A0F3MGP9_9RICK|nr:virB4 protein precursor [Candidatus Orientia mediorientalis]KJV54935.1 cagE, TrbE, VirB, component of type IV transporter system family protein [Orientia chuto str. Dubai]
MGFLHKFLHSRKIDEKQFNHNAQDFIPIACHYNNETLLTKNGELIQILQIKGINSEYTNKDLLGTRAAIRNAIKSYINSSFAVWIHVVRHCDNIDDSTPYNQALPNFIHSIWSKKNYLQNKFVSTLYISIVRHGCNLNIRNFDSFLNSLSFKTLNSFYDDSIASSLEKLSLVTNNIIAGLKRYNPRKLTIRIENNNAYSDLLSFYQTMIQLNIGAVEVKDVDCSVQLATHKYFFGGDKIEIVHQKDKKFAAILSIKEYQDIKDEIISKCIYVPIEFIATEIFYFADQEKAASSYTQQSKVVSASRDSELAMFKGINAIVDSDILPQFCHQQISIMIMDDDVDTLESNVSYISQRLGKQGITHVREDINLAQTFWAQLPGNFNYIRRVSYNIIDNVAALAALQHYPVGMQHSVWGRAVTIFQTEYGTPYFMNFHDKTAKGHTCIIGTANSGKATIANFLLAESSKYSPTILYLTNRNNAQIFIKGIEGKWYNDGFIFNPLSCLENSADLLELLKIITGHYFNNLTDNEIECVTELAAIVTDIAPESRSLIKISKAFNFRNYDAGASIKKRINLFINDDRCSKNFNQSSAFEILDNNITAINLADYTDYQFSQSYVSEVGEKPEIYQKKLQTLHCLRSAIIFSLIKKFSLIASKNPKIIVIDNMPDLIVEQVFIHLIKHIAEQLSQNNGIILSVVQVHQNNEFYYSDFWKNWLNLNNTKIILPTGIRNFPIAEICKLKANEAKKFNTISPNSRFFMVQQDNSYVILELNLEGFPAIRKLLSADKEDLNLFHEIQQKIGDEAPSSWLSNVYDQFQNSE